MNKHEKIVHEYDGIQEENHPMPVWWITCFVTCIIFALIYYIHYEVAQDGKTQLQELTVALEQLEKNKLNALAQEPAITEEQILAKVQDVKSSELGAQVFQAKCAMCHGEKLEGKIGPNLTDAEWRNGHGQVTEIYEIVKKGVVSKGMPSWDGVLSNDEIASLVALIKSREVL